MSTEIVPVEPTEPEAEAPEAPPKRRRRWPIVLAIIVGVLVVLGVVAFFVVEAVAKNYARAYVHEQIAAALQLPDDAEVDVDLGDGSIIFQALAGRVDTVDVDVPEVALGELTGALRFRAEGVPLDANAPVEVLRVDFVVEADDLTALSDGVDDTAAPTFEFVEGELVLSGEIALFGSTIPLHLTLEPSAVDGDLVMTPTSITLGSETFEPGDSDSFLGQLLAGLFQPQNLCIAGGVPQALVLTDAAVDDGELVLTFTGDGAALGGPEFTTPGTCPAS